MTRWIGPWVRGLLTWTAVSTGALGATGLTWGWLSDVIADGGCRLGPGPSLRDMGLSGDTVTVVAASRTLHPGVPIRRGDLFVVHWPVALLPDRPHPTDATRRVVAQTFPSRERLVGRIPGERILDNELIRAERLRGGPAGQGTGFVVPRGLRAMSLDVTGADALAGWLVPGQFVDVLVSRDEGVDTVVQVVPVIAVNSRARGERRQDVGARLPQRPSVTVLVTPGQAEDLALAGGTAALSLSLRARGDAASSAVSMAYVQGRPSPRERPAMPMDPRAIRVIRSVCGLRR